MGLLLKLIQRAFSKFNKVRYSKLQAAAPNLAIVYTLIINLQPRDVHLVNPIESAEVHCRWKWKQEYVCSYLGFRFA